MHLKNNYLIIKYTTPIYVKNYKGKKSFKQNEKK